MLFYIDLTKFDYKEMTTLVISVLFNIFFPLGVIIYFIYISNLLLKSRGARKRPPIKALIIKYLIIGFIYILFYAPMIILYFITINHKLEEDTFRSWLSYISYIFLISKDFALCSLRFLFGYVKLDCFKNVCNNKFK